MNEHGNNRSPEWNQSRDKPKLDQPMHGELPSHGLRRSRSAQLYCGWMDRAVRAFDFCGRKKCASRHKPRSLAFFSCQSEEAEVRRQAGCRRLSGHPSVSS